MGELYRAGEVATQLGIPPSTLRLYSVRFAGWLSAGAASPGAVGGRKGHRNYTEGDVVVLGRVKALLSRGRTVAEAQAALGPPTGPQAASAEPRWAAGAGRTGASTAVARPLGTTVDGEQVRRERAMGEAGPGVARDGDGTQPKGAAAVVSAAEGVRPSEADEQVIPIVLRALAEAQQSEAVWRRLLERRRREAEWLRLETLRQEVELARLAGRLNERMRVVLRRLEQLVEPVQALALEQSVDTGRGGSRRR